MDSLGLLKILRRLKVTFDFTKLKNFDSTDLQTFQMQLRCLPSHDKLWEDYINAQYWEISDEPLISIENKIDSEFFPADFSFITESMILKEISDKNFSEPVGCTCTAKQSKSCHTSSNCCQIMMDKNSGFAYDSEMRLVPGQTVGNRIYECGSKCSCSEECLNR